MLAGLGLRFEVMVLPGIAEDYPDGLKVEKIPEYIAREKASAYVVGANDLVITADTVVVLDGDVLGKPKDEAEAKNMLRRLSGKTHAVTTGVALTTYFAQKVFHVTTKVTFKSLSEDEICYYVENFHPLDKAGAYGIQEWIGYIGVTAIKGSYFNVMGLPVQRIYEEMQRL